MNEITRLEKLLKYLQNKHCIGSDKYSIKAAWILELRNKILILKSGNTESKRNKVLLEEKLF